MRIVFALSTAIALAGCANVDPGPRPALPATIAAADGVVLVKVIGVQPLGFTNSKWAQLKLYDKSVGRAVVLADQAAPNIGYSLFTGAVAPGRYEITGLDAPGVAPFALGLVPALIIQGMTSDSQRIGSQLGSFTVRAGALTNLGVVVSAMPDDKDPKAGFTTAVVADAAGRGSSLGDLDATSRARVGALPELGWDTAPAEGDSARALDIVRTRAVNVSAVEALDDKRIAIGSALGMIHVRATDGKWTSVSTGGLDTVTLLRVLGDGSVVAGTDSGRCLVGSADLSRWRSFGVAEGERVVGVEPAGAAGLVIATQVLRGVQFRNHLFLKADPASADAAVPLLKVDGPFSLPLFFDGSAVTAYANVPGIMRTADIHRIDLGTRRDVPGTAAHWVWGFYSLADGTLVRERMNGISRYSDFSADRGATWSEGLESGSNGSRFVDRLLGYGLRNVGTGWSTVTLALQKTTDGGRSWTRVGAPVEAAGPAQIRVVGGTLFVFTGRQLLSSLDEGKSWRVEWPLSKL